MFLSTETTSFMGSLGNLLLYNFLYLVILFSQYKYPEGSIEERRALNNEYVELPTKDHDIEFTVLEAEYEFRQDVKLQVKVENKGGQQRKIRGNILCQAVTYTERFILTDICSTL